jgi:hypothetical protein
MFCLRLCLGFSVPTHALDTIHDGHLQVHQNEVEVRLDGSELLVSLVEILYQSI